MSQALSKIVGYPVEAVAFSRFGGFNLDRRFSDFQNPAAPVIRHGTERTSSSTASTGSALALRLMAASEHKTAWMHWRPTNGWFFENAAFHLSLPTAAGCGRRVSMKKALVEKEGQVWWRLTGEAETWSTYHPGKTAGEDWKFGWWLTGRVPAGADHGVGDLHPLTYHGEFWVRYEEAWRASCCKFLSIRTAPAEPVEES